MHSGTLFFVATSCVTTPRFACGSMVLADLLVCGFKARSALKPHTFEK
jgi:hypothetical protein